MDEMLEQITPLQNLLTGFLTFMPRLIFAIVLFLLALYVARLGFRLIENALKKRRVDPELALLLARVAQIGIVILGTILALSTVDFDVTAFVAGLGIVGFTVGFALKDVAENFVAGVLLLLQQPFDIGDAVEAGGFTGTVTTIEIRSTTVRTWDGLLVIIPNAQIYSNPITNYSKVPQRRISVDVGVGYESDLQRVDDVLLEVAHQLPGIKDDPAPFVVFKEFGDSSINATLYFWIDTGEAGYFGSLDAIVKGIKTAFDREGINIPFPIRTLYMEQGAGS
jgi:small conductance mechanosensitive channel